MAVTVAVITDEISPDLDTCLAFVAEEGVKRVDVRSVGGVNFMSLTGREQADVSRRIRAAGLEVGCLATPLLKWSAPGKAAGRAGDQFGFDAKGRTHGELYEAAFEAAGELGTRHLRIFSYLTYDGFQLADLEAAYGELLALAEKYDMWLHVENEPVCNVLSVADLERAMRAWNHPRLRGLLDIGNAYSSGQPPTPADVAGVMAFVDQIHFKDYSAGKRRLVATGEGDIPYADLLTGPLRAQAGRDITLTVETHVPDDQPGATRRSLAAVRALAAGIA